MDSLVCPRLEFNYRYLFAWWLFMPLLVIFTAILIVVTYKKAIADAIFFIACYPAMLLDFLYILEIPAPGFWCDSSYVWWWHPAYLLFGYPWTIKEQCIYWLCSFGALTIYYILTHEF